MPQNLVYLFLVAKSANPYFRTVPKPYISLMDIRLIPPYTHNPINPRLQCFMPYRTLGVLCPQSAYKVPAHRIGACPVDNRNDKNSSLSRARAAKKKNMLCISP